jgi:hypothetical protein
MVMTHMVASTVVMRLAASTVVACTATLTSSTGVACTTVMTHMEHAHELL